MKRIDLIILALLFLVLPTIGEKPFQTSSCWNQTKERAVKKAFLFLENLFDPSLDLLPEYPGAKVYWLYHDNYLASKVLKLVRPDLALRLEKAIQRYGVTHSGKIEILFGETQHPLPFRIPELITIVRKDQKEIGTERVTSQVLKNWQEYSDLLFLAGIAKVQSDYKQALKCFRQALAMWDGKGFCDRVTQSHHLYNTYKLALAIITARKLKQPLPMQREILARLLKQQSPSGGFITDYNTKGQPVGLPNVETTCLVILALSSGD